MTTSDKQDDRLTDEEDLQFFGDPNDVAIPEP